MGLADPVACLFAVIPDVLGLGENTSESFGAFALFYREAFGSAFPSGLRDDLEFVGACGFVIEVESSGEAFEGALWESGGDSGFEIADALNRWREARISAMDAAAIMVLRLYRSL